MDARVKPGHDMCVMARIMARITAPYSWCRPREGPRFSDRRAIEGARDEAAFHHCMMNSDR
jgi:hypothetical protein